MGNALIGKNVANMKIRGNKSGLTRMFVSDKVISIK